MWQQPPSAGSAAAPWMCLASGQRLTTNDSLAPRNSKLETIPVDLPALLAPFLAGAQRPAPAALYEQLERYLDLLLRWNARMNLTASRDPEYIVTRHIGESLFTAVHLFPAGQLPIA